MCFSNFAGFQTTRTQGYDWNRLNLTGVSEGLWNLEKLKESFKFQDAFLKEYNKLNLPSERSVIKTLNDDARQSYGFVLVAIWSSESDVFDYCMNSVINLQLVDIKR